MANCMQAMQSGFLPMEINIEPVHMQTMLNVWAGRYHGRKRVMMYSGIVFMIAAIILCAAEHIAMIVVGRVLQGIAVSLED